MRRSGFANTCLCFRLRSTEVTLCRCVAFIHERHSALAQLSHVRLIKARKLRRACTRLPRTPEHAVISAQCFSFASGDVPTRDSRSSTVIAPLRDPGHISCVVQTVNLRRFAEFIAPEITNAVSQARKSCSGMLQLQGTVNTALKSPSKMVVHTSEMYIE